MKTWYGHEIYETIYTDSYRDLVSSIYDLLKTYPKVEDIHDDKLGNFIPLLKRPAIGEPFLFCPNDKRFCLFVCTEYDKEHTWMERVMALPLLVTNPKPVSVIALDSPCGCSDWGEERFFRLKPLNTVCI